MLFSVINIVLEKHVRYAGVQYREGTVGRNDRCQYLLPPTPESTLLPPKDEQAKAARVLILLKQQFSYLYPLGEANISDNTEC